MKYVDEYRSANACQRLVEEIRTSATVEWTLMEVCGGQTHGLLRHGIDQALAGAVRLIHGPGCPVCVTPAEDLDFAVDLCKRPGITVVSFGDMLRVPGSRESLQQARAGGGKVQFVYSPLDVLQLAEERPDEQFIFLAVGFETTAPATALVVRQAARQGLKNLSLLVSHVRVLPAMQQLVQNDGHGIQGFLAAGHVCTVTGYREYRDFARSLRTPVVVTGFEPFDLLSGIKRSVQLLEADRHCVCNEYERSVREDGNPSAKRLVASVFQPCDRAWRGMGVIPAGGLQLKPQWSEFDARRRFESQAEPLMANSRCRSGEVLSGRIKPTACEHFGDRCTPESPLGAPMVSAEGACAAYYQYARVTALDTTQSPCHG
ncbi:MAG: hydrogenase formation protein HypD [Planctomycetota bacterium]